MCVAPKQEPGKGEGVVEPRPVAEELASDRNVTESHECLEYKITRSLRRGSSRQAQNQGIPSSVIETNQRWRKHEGSQGSLTSMEMRD